MEAEGGRGGGKYVQSVVKSPCLLFGASLVEARGNPDFCCFVENVTNTSENGFPLHIVLIL